jgi:hypothetical protein
LWNYAAYCPDYDYLRYWYEGIYNEQGPQIGYQRSV